MEKSICNTWSMCPYLSYCRQCSTDRFLRFGARSAPSVERTNGGERFGFVRSRKNNVEIFAQFVAKTLHQLLINCEKYVKII